MIVHAGGSTGAVLQEQIQLHGRRPRPGVTATAPTPPTHARHDVPRQRDPNAPSICSRPRCPLLSGHASTAGAEVGTVTKVGVRRSMRQGWRRPLTKLCTFGRAGGRAPTLETHTSTGDFLPSQGRRARCAPAPLCDLREALAS